MAGFEFKFMGGLFGGKGDKMQSSRAIEHATSGTVAASGAGGSNTSVFDQSRGGWDIDRAVRDGLERVIWIFRCVDAISANMSSLIINGRKGDPTDGEEYDLPEDIFRLLNRRPNGYESAQQFKYRLSSQLLLSKRGAFIEIEKTNGQQIGQLHLLPSHMVEPIPDPRKFVSGYRVKKGNGSEEDELKPHQVIWIRTRPHPLDPYSQLTPLTAAGIVAETDFLARLFNRNFLMNDGRPTTLVTVQGELNSQDAEEIKLRFSGGPMYAGRTTVLEADGVTVADLSANPRDVQWLEALRSSKEDLLLSFGVPESVLGNASGRTFDNADAEREGFWKDTMVPHCDAIARALDPLTGSLDDDNYMAFDYTKVDVLQRQKKAREDALRAQWQAGEITLDELLEATGRKPLNLPGSRAHILAGGIVITDESDYAAIKAIPVIGQPDPNAGFGDPSMGGAVGLPSPSNGETDMGNVLAARMQQFLGGSGSNASGQPMLRGPNYGKVLDGEVVVQGKEHGLRRRPEREKLEGQVAGVLASWCGSQERVVPGRLSHAKVLKFTRHWVGEKGFGDKALNPKYVVQVDRWKNDLSRDMRAVLQPAIARNLKRATDEMDNSGFTRMMHARGMTTRNTGTSIEKVFGSTADARNVSGKLLEELLGVASRAAEAHSRRVADRIEQMDAEGKSVKQIEAEIKRMIGQRSQWQRQLATYLTTAAIEGAAHEAWSRAGKLVTKVWNTVGDEHVRPSHQAVDGSTKSLSQKFRVGKSSLRYPSDPLGPPAETANCRCWLDFDVNDSFAGVYDVEAG